MTDRSRPYGAEVAAVQADIVSSRLRNEVLELISKASLDDRLRENCKLDTVVLFNNIDRAIKRYLPQ